MNCLQQIIIRKFRSFLSALITRIAGYCPYIVLVFFAHAPLKILINLFPYESQFKDTLEEFLI